MSAIEFEGVSRTFWARPGVFRRRSIEVRALTDVSFSVEPGELFGLLGPNGAGKTTTIKILTTLLLPTSGRARVLGFDPAREPQRVRPRIGYVFGGDRGLYDRLSALDNLRYFADVYRVPVAREEPRGSTSCSSWSGCKGASGSGSRRTRAGCGSGCISPGASSTTREVLFLDEPTIGLDPVGARELRETVAGLQRRRQDDPADDALHVRGGRALRAGSR